MSFVAPEVRILVVDDNRMSLKLTGSLLASFEIQVDSAESGEMALAMLRGKHYHLVLMDYMMPGMDGVETTQSIRAMEDAYYHEIPVIALTGDETPDHALFLEAGMNDFLPKPLEKKLLGTVLRKWLPENLIHSQYDTNSMNAAETIQNAEEAWPNLQGIDIAEGIKNSGGKELFIGFLGDFYKLIDVKSDKLEKCMADKLIKEYNIEVHALKNSARIIGATELFRRFWRMEQLGRAGDVETIVRELPGLLMLYRSYKPILKPYGVIEDADKRDATVDEIIFYLRGLQEAIEAFDMDRADEAMERLEELRLPKVCNPLMDKLRAAVADVAMENILVLTEEMISFLKE